MASVSVTPQEFHFVRFDAARIKAVVAGVAEKVGLPDGSAIAVEIDESTPLGRARVTAVEPITLSVEGGAFENPKRPRELSERATAEVVARLLFRVRDRLDPAFGVPPDDADLSLQQATAWDTYCVGRAGRIGVEVFKPRRLYHFRSRHGFSDIADAAFERLWSGEGLTWADIEAACAETAAEREAATA